MQRFLPAAAVGSIAALVIAGAAWLAIDDGPNAVTVGERAASQSTVDGELEILAEHPDFASGLVGASVEPGAGSIPSTLAASWLTFRIVTDGAEQELVKRGEAVNSQDVEDTGLTGAAGFQQLPKDFRERVVDRLAAVRALQRVLADEPDVKDAASEACNSGRFVSHILVADEATADSLKEQLDNGADFAEVARQNSTDGSASAGGELGCIDGQNFIEPFATVAADTPIGAISAPFQTEAGWHIVLVTDTPPQQEVDAASLNAVLGQLRHFRVEVDPRYGEWDKQNVQVQAPVAPTG